MFLIHLLLIVVLQFGFHRNLGVFKLRIYNLAPVSFNAIFGKNYLIFGISANPSAALSETPNYDHPLL